MTKEEIEKESPAFFADFKWQMVRDYIMEKNDLKIEENDIEDAAKAYVAYQYAQYGMANVPEDIINGSVGRVLQDENTSRRIIENVQNQKVLSAAQAVVTMNEQTVSVEKFREL